MTIVEAMRKSRCTGEWFARFDSSGVISGRFRWEHCGPDVVYRIAPDDLIVDDWQPIHGKELAPGWYAV